MLMKRETRKGSKQALPGQLNLPSRLALLPATLVRTNHTPLPQLKLILHSRESARAMVREMHTGQCTRT